MATQVENPQLPNAAELTPQQIADQIAAQQAPQAPPQEYVVQTDTGAVFRGRDEREVIDQMKKSIEHGSRKIKEQDDELAQYRTQPVEPPAPEVSQPGFDPNYYYQLWAQNPNVAEDYRFQSTFGVTQQEMANQIYESYRFTKQLEPEVVARSWMASSPTFPSWEENPQEVDKAATAIQTLWNEFYPNDTNITPQRLEQMHAVALMRGMYQARQSSPVEASPPAPVFSPMPTLNTGATGGGTGQPQQIAQMTPEQLRAFIEQQPR